MGLPSHAICVYRSGQDRGVGGVCDEGGVMTATDALDSVNRFAEVVAAQRERLRADIKAQIVAQSAGDPDVTDLVAEMMAHFYATIYENGVRNIVLYGQHFNGMSVDTR
jgi:hypothetical protein